MRNTQEISELPVTRSREFKMAYSHDPKFRADVDEMVAETRDEPDLFQATGPNGRTTVKGWAALDQVFIPWSINSSKARHRRQVEGRPPPLFDRAGRPLVNTGKLLVNPASLQWVGWNPES